MKSSRSASSWALLARLAVPAVAMMAVGTAVAGSATYTYDSLGRLVKVVYSNGVTITYTYDAAGNRTTTVTAGAAS